MLKNKDAPSVSARYVNEKGGFFFYNTKYIVQETKWIKKLFGMAGGFHYTEGGSITYYISQIEYLWIHG